VTLTLTVPVVMAVVVLLVVLAVGFYALGYAERLQEEGRRWWQREGDVHRRERRRDAAGDEYDDWGPR
jgi:predicted PurR-regulated permease PerM